MPEEAKAQKSTRGQEGSVDGVSQSVERLILRSVDPDTNDLTWAGECNVEARSDGASSRVSHIIRDPGAKRGKTCKDASSADAEKNVSDSVALAGQTRYSRSVWVVGVRWGMSVVSCLG